MVVVQSQGEREQHSRTRCVCNTEADEVRTECGQCDDAQSGERASECAWALVSMMLIMWVDVGGKRRKRERERENMTDLE